MALNTKATHPESLAGVMDGVDVTVSALGITRQVDGLTYYDVDHQANVNLLTPQLVYRRLGLRGALDVILGPSERLGSSVRTHLRRD